MIRYHLKCSIGHEFDAWFRSSDAFDEQRAEDRVRCAVCGTAEVEKAVMAPAVGVSETPDLTKPASAAEAVLAEMRRKVEEASDYVGKEFADEARRIHDGESARRSIWGEATLHDAKSLGDDGIPVTPIPWMRRRNN